MRKLLIGLLALGLVFAFSMPAAAVDVKVSGQYSVWGFYNDNMSLDNDGDSRANYFQRLRLQPVFQVAEGLKLTTRFDVQERAWGQDPGIPGGGVAPGKFDNQWNRAENNISWERCYVTFNALYGIFDVGYMPSRTWATCSFCNETDSDPRIQYTYNWENWKFQAAIEKREENDWQGGAQEFLGETDRDRDIYQLYYIYKWENGQHGTRVQYDLDANTYGLDDGKLKEWEIAPYVDAVYGPMWLQAEVRYLTGTYEEDCYEDIDVEGWSVYVKPQFNMGPGYVGFEFAWIQGDDPETNDYEAGRFGGTDWDPLLILFNFWNTKSNGLLGTNVTTGASMGANNADGAWLYKLYGGYSPMEKLDLYAAIAYSEADETYTGWDDEYGTEFDISATYKIYDNLSYQINFAYLWAGDYFKAGNACADEVDDTYLVMHKLQLSF